MCQKTPTTTTIEKLVYKNLKKKRRKLTHHYKLPHLHVGLPTILNNKVCYYFGEYTKNFCIKMKYVKILYIKRFIDIEFKRDRVHD